MGDSFLSRALPALIAASAFASLLGSCGGKSGETYDGSGGSTASGGGKASGGTNPGSGGTGTAGGPNCSTVDCAQIRCAPPYIPMTPPGKCCAECVPDPMCGLVLCADVLCEPGYHSQVLSGECCPTCVQDANCNLAGWETLYETLSSGLDAFTCSLNSDCTVVTLGSLCKLDCGTAVNTASAPALTEQLVAYAQANCAGCPQTGAACPPVVYTAVCTNGACALSP